MAATVRHEIGNNPKIPCKICVTLQIHISNWIQNTCYTQILQGFSQILVKNVKKDQIILTLPGPGGG